MSTLDSAKKSKKIGRPSVDTEAVNVRLSREMLVALDDWRRSQNDIPSRPEAVRRLIATAMEGA